MTYFHRGDEDTGMAPKVNSPLPSLLTPDSKMQKVPGLRDASARHKPEKERSYCRERERRNGMG